MAEKTCPRCNGEGYIPLPDSWLGDDTFDTEQVCPRCNAVGTVPE